MTILNLGYLCDAPKPWGLYFQDSTSPQMEALIELHDNIMFYLVIVLFGVAWILTSIIRNYIYTKSPISNKYLNHGTLIELIWTITPALILILIAFPSFKFLYLMDEVTDPSLTIFVKDHQWYWSYQYPDFFSDESDSHLIAEYNVDGVELCTEDNLIVYSNEINHNRPWEAVSNSSTIASVSEATPVINLSCKLCYINGLSTVRDCFFYGDRAENDMIGLSSAEIRVGSMDVDGINRQGMFRVFNNIKHMERGVTFAKFTYSQEKLANYSNFDLRTGGEPVRILGRHMLIKVEG